MIDNNTDHHFQEIELTFEDMITTIWEFLGIGV